jgi:tetratricopeptide (TPR) repeat protein
MGATFEDAAFGQRPDLVITTVPADPRARWLAGVVLGAQGRYARAATLLAQLADQRNDLGALAAATLASHRRQLGGHAAARPLDARALANATSDEARADALLGLAADAIGAGRLDEARRLRDRAPRTTWRSRIRSDWVAAEIELSAGRPDAARPYAERATEESEGTRHRVKSKIILGAAMATVDPAMARKLVTQARDDATDLHLLSLVWPASLLLADLDPDERPSHRRRADDVLHSVLRRSDPRGRELAERSPWVPTATGPTG